MSRVLVSAAVPQHRHPRQDPLSGVKWGHPVALTRWRWVLKIVVLTNQWDNGIEAAFLTATGSTDHNCSKQHNTKAKTSLLATYKRNV